MNERVTKMEMKVGRTIVEYEVDERDDIQFCFTRGFAGVDLSIRSKKNKKRYEAIIETNSELYVVFEFMATFYNRGLQACNHILFQNYVRAVKRVGTVEAEEFESEGVE